MSENYDQICSLAKRLGYAKFTDLQKKAFEESGCYDFEKWLFVIGATSSGKTLIPLLYYFREYELHKQDNMPFRMLFAVPYRALAGQKKDEISELLQKLNLNLRVAQSTGEYRNDDVDIRQGKVDIAVMIYEKIFMFSSMDSDFLKRYELLVMDEIGLTQDLARGLKADFILARARKIPSMRVIALATPFYDWKHYLEAYRFISVKEEKRPIDIKRYPVYYTKVGVNFVQDDCEAIQPFVFPELHNGSFEVNPRQRLDFIIEKICRHHLEQGHKILIFENNREEVRRLAQRLCVSLTDSESISPWISEKECRSYIGKRVNLGDDDELYGVMGDADYRAFASGIGYHNADLPTALRELVEREILKKDGKLQIVCSTETLAYGINSNVDVVIIPKMMKQRNEERQQYSFLTPNEFMNYAGRAGRLLPDIDTWERAVGYVYPVLKAKYCEDADQKENQQVFWEALLETSEEPQIISSRYYSVTQMTRAFYLLSLFPNDRNDVKENREITAEWLKGVLNSIPGSPLEKAEELDVEQQIDYLLERRLICRGEESEEDAETYCLTDTGKNLTGYIIDIGTFDHLLNAAYHCVTETAVYAVDILKEIIETEEIRQHAEQHIGKIHSCYEAQLKRVVEGMSRVFEKQDRAISEELKRQQLFRIKDFKEWQRRGQYEKLAKNREFCSMRLLAALLTWKEEPYAVKKLYDGFAVSYTQMRRFAEQVSYYLDIVSYALPVVRVENGESLYKKVGGKRLREVQEELRELSGGIFYRIPTYICRFLNLQCCDPYEALRLREVAEIYSFLEAQSHNGGQLSKKEKNKINRSIQKIEKWPVEWKNAFYDRFGGILKNEY